MVEPRGNCFQEMSPSTTALRIKDNGFRLPLEGRSPGWLSRHGGNGLLTCCTIGQYETVIKKITATTAIAAAVLVGVSGCAGASARDDVCETFATATNARVLTENQFRADTDNYAQGSDELNYSALMFEQMFQKEHDAAVAASKSLKGDAAETELVALFGEVIEYGRDLPERADYVARDQVARDTIAQCAAEGAEVTYVNLAE